MNWTNPLEFRQGSYGFFEVVGRFRMVPERGDLKLPNESKFAFPLGIYQ